MTYCETILADFAFSCKSIGDGVLYVESPFTYGFDGQMVGSYLIGADKPLVKITDNADLMFQAMVSGVAPRRSTSKMVRRIAESHGLEFSDEGEMFAYAKQDEIPSLMARLVEASIKSADVLGGIIAKDVSKFEKIVGARLRAVYGKSVKANFLETGASGHQLRFPFAIIGENSSSVSLIQTISSFEERPHWASVYNTVGKMLDVKGANEKIGRFAVLEHAQSEQVAQAKKVLSQAATVLMFSSDFEIPLAA